MILQGTKSALGPGLTASFLASGGTGPYVYSVQADGAGGSIDSSTGLYTAPASGPTDPRKFYDTVIATDSLGATATLEIMVANSWMLLADVLRRDLNLPLERVYFWNKKVNMPTDDGMFIILAMPRSKPLSTNTQPSGTPVGDGGPGWDQTTIWSQVNASVDVHIYSRGSEAVNRLPEVFASLAGPYSQRQQLANGFYISKLPRNAVDLSGIDGAAIPFHFVISLETIYTYRKVFGADYYDTFQNPPEILINA